MPSCRPGSVSSGDKSSTERPNPLDCSFVTPSRREEDDIDEGLSFLERPDVFQPTGRDTETLCAAARVVLGATSTAFTNRGLTSDPKRR